MKRIKKSPQYVTCRDCGKRIILTLAKKGVCPACHVAEWGHPILDVRISGKAVEKEHRPSYQSAFKTTRESPASSEHFRWVLGLR